MKEERKSEINNVAIASATHELTQRYGEAGSQFLIGLRGLDNQTGKVFDRSLHSISQGKINPEYAKQNIKQQAGYSAEVVHTSKRNAQHIIDGSTTRTYRSEDVTGYGKNHTVVDILDISDEGVTTSQMKFITDQEGLLQKIACGEGGGKTDMSRYLDVDRLDVPTEQVESMKTICHDKSISLRQQSRKLEKQGKLELANKKSQQAENYEALEGKINDSGLTTEEAIRYRKSPMWETTKDIAQTSHQAGIQGAKFGLAIGGTVSAVTNVIAACSGDKEFSEAVLDTTKDTIIAGATGYGTAATGAAIKSVMTQSSQEVVRNLSKTGMPAMVVSICLSMGKSIKKYTTGELSEAELVEEVGLTASGMMSATMFTTIGQVAIPVPVLGAMVGGMVGYALTNTFYQSFFDALKDAKLSKERRIAIEMQCAAAEIVALEYKYQIDNLFEYKLQKLDISSQKMFAALSNNDLPVEQFCEEMNRFAEELGAHLPIKNMAELDEVMLSDQPLIF